MRDQAELDAVLRAWLTRESLIVEGPDFDRFREFSFEAHAFSYPPEPRISALKGSAPVVTNGMTVTQLFEAYAAEGKLSEKARAEWKSVLRRLIDHVGEVSVRSITKDQMVEFKDLLVQTPKRIPSEHRKLPLPKLVEATKDEPIERLSATSVNKTMGLAAALFGWGVQNNKLASNPAQGVKAKEQKVKDRRLPYSQADITALFGSGPPAGTPA